MADYQRFVSYLHEYQNNQKSKNCGFCRVELRDHTCRLEIHLKLPLYPFTPTLKVYAFVPSTEKLYGIFLGNASYHQGNVSGTFLFSEKNIKNSSYSFSQLGGIFIQTETGFCFASAWKDLTIHPENFIVYENKSAMKTITTKDFKSEFSFPNPDTQVTLDKSNTKSHQSEDSSLSSTFEAENISRLLSDNTTKEKMSKSNTQPEAEISIESKKATEILAPPHAQVEESTQSTNSTTSENPTTTIPSASSQETLPTTISNEFTTTVSSTSSKESIQAATTSEKTTQITLSQSAQDSIPLQNSDATPESSEPSLLAASLDTTTPPKEKQNFWENLLESYPQCHPFFDDEIHNCVQLSPNDVPKISTCGYPIANNPFFRHNCQSFQHFLVGKKESSTSTTDTPKTQYILAVPGIYNSKEQYMASMFGFPHFKRNQNSCYRKNCWGYWYRIIPENWNNCHF